MSSVYSIRTGTKCCCVAAVAEVVRIKCNAMYSKTLANFLLKFKQSFQFQLDRGFGPLIPLGLCPQTQLEACTSALVMLFQPSNPGYAYET